jgi:hypothetical protein
MTPLFDELPRPIRDRLNYGTITADDDSINRMYYAIQKGALIFGEERIVKELLEFLDKREVFLLKESI